jgi:hypothetical protein
LRKASSRHSAGLDVRSRNWDDVRRILEDLVRDDESRGRDLCEIAERCLLREILARYPNDVRTTAALLGVTEPTCHRRLAAHHVGDPAPVG